MTVQAAQTLYRQEFIAAFEEGQSWLRSTVTTEAIVKGNVATFLVAGTGGANAVTRGQSGLIPARTPSNTQSNATLVEWHDLQQLTDFDIFASQSDQRRIMQMGSVKVLNRKIDEDIIAILDTATIDTGAAATASVRMVTKSLAALGNAEVPTNEVENMFGVVTPGFWAYMMETDEFSNGQWVEVKPYAGPIRRMFRWLGVNWITHPNLTGVGTAAEKCYIYHKDAIGHAFDSRGMNVAIGHNDEHHYDFVRASGYFGSVKLQNAGIVQMVHDGSAFALS